MEELKALVRVISKNKLKQIELIGKNNEEDNNINTLYNGIASEKFNSESDAEKFFYGNNKNSRAYYTRLKRQLKDRLISNLFLIDNNQPNFTQIQRAYDSCFRNLAAVKILLGKHARKAAIPIAENTLRKAKKFEFSEIALELAKVLRLHYGAILGDRKNFRKYNKLVKKYSAIHLAEIKAEEYFAELMTNFANSSSTKLEFLTLAKRYYSELREILKKYHSYRLSLHAYAVFVMRYEIENDYSNVLRVCNEALRFFKTKKHLASNTAIFTFSLRILSSNIILRKYEEAGVAAIKCAKLAPEGSNNWFLTLNFHMILCFHSKNFQKAFSIYQKVVNNPYFNHQNRNISENWRIHEAFIHYFISIGKIKVARKEKVKKFRLSKFLNEVPTFSKDKRGANVTILILQVLFLLQQGQYDKIIDRMEPLKTYNHRYLRKDDTFRSNCFIKMLLQLPKNSFHKAAVLRKADKYWEKLKSVPINVANQSSEIEIVPYETLWQYILESLDNGFH